MSTAVIQPAFSVGELAPSLFGRVDLEQWHMAASTMRNFFVNYRGGSSSRAGTAFIGRAGQLGTALPPRLIPFRFSIQQNYGLEFGDFYMRVISDGGYVTETAQIITGVSQANPGTITIAAHGYSNGNWVAISGVGGTTEINNQIFQVANATTNTFNIKDIFGNFVNTLTFGVYTSGGTAAKIYTLVTPYAVADLPALKFTQSADVMSLTHPSYPPYDLTRVSATSWTISAVTFSASISAPTTCTATPSNTASPVTQYVYCVTAVNGEGEESVASPFSTVTNSVQMSSVAGSVNVVWAAVNAAFTYNIYRSPASYNNAPPVGTLFGYIGSSLGLNFIDTNITEDMTRGPPLHLNPFASGGLAAITVTAGGSGYTALSVASVNTSTGSGASLTPVIISGALVAIIIYDGGQNYAPGDTISVSVGTGATTTLTVGPTTGIYPSVCAYFQQRRVYANTLNNPDTYWMSQPGYYTNMDQGVIPIDSDAIVGTPWAQQVNGIQALVPMPGGLVVFTGLGVWQVGGLGSSSTPITPSGQSAQPQAANGCHDNIQPIPIGYDILYVQTKGSIVRDISYSFYANIYTGADLSVLSEHLFTNHTLLEWAWVEEPYKLVWAVRDDGILLSLTYLKEQDTNSNEKPQSTGWSRHDTNGIVVSVCSISELPVDVLYLIVKRYVQGQWLYFVERMDDRLWSTIEDAWCVDAGLALAQPEPAATLMASTATGDSGIGSLTIVEGGTGYTAPVIEIVDPTGSGATFSVTLAGGIISAITVLTPGEDYSDPQVIVADAAGSGAILNGVIENTVTFTASDPIWTVGDIGDIIRMGGGIAVVTGYTSPTSITANITSPILVTIPNDPDNVPVPAVSGNWSQTTPVSVLTGLQHLEGKIVSILADGGVVAQQVVVDGSITLNQAASCIVVGLPYQCQLQSLYVDIPGEPTVQGKRKLITAATVRVVGTRGLKVGSNQVDASVQPQTNPITWTNMVEIKQNNPFAGRAIPLFTGDQRVIVSSAWRKPGQVACQQDYPLPANILAFIPEVTVGDTNG